MSDQASTEITNPPQIYIMIDNPSKSNNLGPILRCGAAYSAIFIFIGYDKCAVEGSHGANKHVQIRSFPTTKQAVEYVKGQGVGSIVGILSDASFRDGRQNDFRAVSDDGDVDVHAPPSTDASTSNIVNVKAEIQASLISERNKYPNSWPIHTRKFHKGQDVCFSISKRAVGLPTHQAQYCDSFVHIAAGTPFLSEPDTDMDGGSTSTSSNNKNVICGLLDAQTSLSICLHHYAAFAGYRERDFIGQKFHVEARVGKDEEQSRVIKEQRLQRKLEEKEDADDVWESGEMASMMDIFA